MVFNLLYEVNYVEGVNMNNTYIPLCIRYNDHH